MQGNQVTMKLQNNGIHIPIDIGGTNLPVFNNSFVNKHQNRAIGSQMRSSLAYSRLSKIDFFGDLQYIRSLQVWIYPAIKWNYNVS